MDRTVKHTIKWAVGPLAATAFVVAVTAAQPAYTTLVADLNNPHGLTVYGDTLLVAEGGTGQYQPGRFAPGNGDGRVRRFSVSDPSDPQTLSAELANVVGANGIVMGANHAVWRVPEAATSTAMVALSGGPGHPDPKAKVLVVEPGAGLFYLADPWAFEEEHNPDGGDIDSNPWRLVHGPDGLVYVTDGGANDLLQFDPASGDLALYAIFESVGTIPGGGPIPAAPTGLAFDPHKPGVAYVALLGLGPVVEGQGQIRRLEDINDDGDVLDAGENTLYADGLTTPIDLAFSPSGHLFVVEAVPGRVSLVRQSGDVNDRMVEKVGGLFNPTAMAFLDDGDLLVTAFGAADAALVTDRVLRIRSEELAPGTDAETPTVTAAPPTETEPATETPTATATMVPTKEPGPEVFVPFTVKEHSFDGR